MNNDQLNLVQEAITGTFMWSFKKGDNIVYNFEIIWELYNARAAVGGSQRRKFIKPIVLLQVSIVECILDDFVNRIQGHVNDRVPNITPEQIEDFRTKKRDKLEHYISAAKKHNLFDATAEFYEDMDKLRKARNRFHIQNSKYEEPLNEYVLFDEPLLRLSESTFEKVLSTMMNKFFRGRELRVQFRDVPLPWSSEAPAQPAQEERTTNWLCIGCGVPYPANVDLCINCFLPRPW